MGITFSGIGVTYNPQTVDGSKGLEDTLNSDLSKATDDELMAVCKDFEAYFLEQMLKEMQKMIPKTEKQSAATTQLQDYYKDEMIKELAQDSTENGGLGLAQTLYEQMKRNYNL